jgi:alanine dehydrogenase
MIVGIPKESPPAPGLDERRVGLTPAGVAELRERDASVVVESGAGTGAHFNDADYERAGAEIVFTHEEAFQRADVVGKVGPPIETELELLRDRQVLLGFQHLVTAPRRHLDALLEGGITAVSYELIETADGDHPVLEPTSEIAGALVPQLAGRLLERGRGTLLASVPGIPPADVVILGGGTLGYHAARALRGLGSSVYILERDPRRLQELDRLFGGHVVTVLSTRAAVEKFVRFADVLIGAVLVSGERAPQLVTRAMLETMEPGAVILDFAIDQGGCVATSRPIPHPDDAYQDSGVWHVTMPNASSLVARTASHALTNAVLPYLRRLAQADLPTVWAEYPELSRGVSTHNGGVTRPELARAHGYDPQPLEAPR